MKHLSRCFLQSLIGPSQIFISFLFVMILQGCATVPEVPVTYDPATQARIRVFHGTAAYLYLGDVCDHSAHPVIHAGVGGFSYFVANKKIGMPATDDLPFSYNEYVIPAGKPITVNMYWQAQKANGAWDYCGPFYQMFTPEAGQDYDTLMKFSWGVCKGMEVRKLVSGENGKANTISAPLDGLPFRECR